jgi:hypothetical protein
MVAAALAGPTACVIVVPWSHMSQNDTAVSEGCGETKAKNPAEITLRGFA